jgi:hypothetical protein
MRAVVYERELGSTGQLIWLGLLGFRLGDCLGIVQRSQCYARFLNPAL